MALHEGDLEHYPRKFGKYHLLGPLAQGGMGALYLAVAGDRGLERLMVIKTVLPHLADAEYVARFRDEAKVVVKLSHGNLIPVFDAGLVGGELFLAMDFVEGRDLRAVWNRCAKKQVAFPIDVAVYIVKELCRGLAYAHSFPDLNLVHRDISPPNVLVSYTGEVKLTDFGLASSTLKLEKTAPGIIYGKVAYMSPEQARGEKLDGRSDMYAAAIVLWELLTGRQLFPPGKDQPQDLLARAKNPEVMRPSKRAPRVPPELDEICLKALAPTKDERYANCDEMRVALQTWLAQNAPATDGTRMSTFLAELFADDIVRERNERNELLNRVRTRALTLPPTDELRKMVETSTGVRISSEDDAALIHDAPVRKLGSVGRRATDRQEEGLDRRRQQDRRGDNPIRGATAAGAAALAQELEEAEPDLRGAEVDGRYRVMELIGEGGMGKVYLAEHVEIGKRVALKVLHPSYSRMPDLVERFRREARAASKIGHPNIVDVTDSGTTPDGSVYFVMEYLEGVELGSVIEREGAIDVARALKITGQICRALAAAHREGIIHRDLKPENIFLITRDGAADVVKVLDFGIAKTTEAEAARERRLTSPGMAMGTPEYMAPEQAAGRPADARCDVYALGAILYEMVTGIPPYTGDNFMEILTKKATQDPPPPLTVRGDLPVQVGDLVMQAMARNPDHRPQTMEALEYELNKALSGRGVAVAQILGMTTDANVVATLNPGLSMRQYDDSMVVARPAVSSPAISLPRALTEGSLWSGPVMATGMNALQRVPTGQQQPLRAASVVEPSDSMREAALVQSAPTVASAPVPQKRSAAAVFGWIVLAAALFGGVGALLYASLGERGQRGGKSAVEGVPPAAAVDAFAGAGAPGSDLAVPVPSPVPDVQAPTPGSGSAGSTDDVVAPPSPPPPHGGAATLRDPHHKGPVHVAPAPPPPHHAPPAISASADDPRSLERQAVAMEQSGDWTAARAQWEKLAKVKGYGGKSLYKQAWAAFQSNEVNDAVRLAEQAAREHDSPYRQDALVLYGDALYRQGDPTHAKAIYVGIRKTANDSTRALMAKKIAACNKALNLPEGDTGE